jgi:hypothetical protein
MSDCCQAALPLAPAGTVLDWVECGAPAVAVHVYRCPAGHERRRATCAAHAPEPGQVGCRTCLEQGRESPMTAELADAGGAS